MALFDEIDPRAWSTDAVVTEAIVAELENKMVAVGRSKHSRGRSLRC